VSLKNLTNFVSNTKKAINNATFRAINKTSSKINTQFRKVMTKETGVASKVLKKRFRIRKATKASFVGGVSFGTKIGLTMDNFKPKVKVVRVRKRKYNGVTIKIGSSGRELVKGAFIGVAKNGKSLVLMRTSERRYPVKVGRVKLFAIADTQRPAISKDAEANYKRIFNEQLKYELSR